MSTVAAHRVPAAALMVAARVVNLALGIVAIPVLIRSLGGEGFSEWAILLALAAGFSVLEIGMAPAMVRHLAPHAQARSNDECRRLVGRMWLLLAMTFGAGLVLVWAGGAAFASWTGLLGTPLLTREELVFAVFFAVSARSLLQAGYLVLMAASRFGAASGVSLLESLASNTIAMAVAWQTQRVDLTLLAYWGARLAVLGIVFIAMGRACLPRFDRRTLHAHELWSLARFGLSSQSEGWSQFVNFQFDKFIIAAWVGLWAVSPYEVANRAVAALRSIPASGADTFLPTAVAAHGGEEGGEGGAWSWYVGSVRLAAYGVVVFLLAPMAIAPVFLYAWTGEMGWLGRWVFTALAFGAAASVLALPAVTLVQVAGRPALQARAALMSLAANVVLSLTLVWFWGQLGAAIGTGLAMIAGAVAITAYAHRHFHRPLRETLAMLARFVPLALVCLAWAVLAHIAFHAWFDTLEPATRYSRNLRIVPGLLAGVAYAALLAALLAVEAMRGGFSKQEREWLAGLRQSFTRRARKA